MPTAIIAAIATAFATITVAQVVFAVASFVISSTMASRAQKKAESAQRAANAAQRAAFNAGLVDRTTVVRSAIQPRNMILGRDEASGPLACWFTHGPKRNLHAFAVVLAGHECDAVETVMFNHEVVTRDANGWVTAPAKYTRTTSATYTESFPSGTAIVLSRTPTREDARVVDSGGDSESGYYSTTHITYTVVTVEPLFQVRTYLGAPGQAAAPELVAAAAAAGIASAWDASRRGTGICYLSVVVDADFGVLGQIGIPNVSAVVRGVKALDARTGLTAWTDNPAVLARWLIVNSGFSPKTLSTEVHATELLASANVCDESVAFSATLNAKRYTCNGQLTSAASPLDNLNHILDSMDGDAVWISGQWQLVAGYYKTPTLTLTEDSLSSAGITIVPNTAKRDLFNALNGLFINPAAGYVRMGYGMVTSTVYQAEDGGELLPAEANFELINDPVRCQMIAWQRLTRARQSLTLQLGTTLRGYDSAPLQNVTVSLRRPGYVNKVFTTLRREFENNTLVYILQETGPEVWAWNYALANAAVNLPNTSYPDVVTVPVVGGVSVAAGDDELQRLADGTIISRARVRWAPVANTYVSNGGRIEWQHKSAIVTADAWTSLALVSGSDVEIYTGPLIDGATMLFRGRCVTSLGRNGDWSQIVSAMVIGKTALPAAPQGVSLTQDSVFCLPSAFSIDTIGFIVRSMPGVVVPTSADFLRASKAHEGYVSGFPWPFASRLYGLQTIMVVAEDSTGNWSSVAYASLDFGQPSDQNIGQTLDYRATSWSGSYGAASVVGGDLLSDVNPASDLNLLLDWNGEPDLNVTLRLPLVYEAALFVPLYGGGTLVLDVLTEGPQAAVEYRINGSTTNNLNALADWNLEANLNGPTFGWAPWPGALLVQRGIGYALRVSIAGGSQQPVVKTLTARLALQRATQTFPPMAIAAGGTRLSPANGLPPLTWVSVQSVAMLAEVDGSGATSGRFIDLSPTLGPLVQQVNSSGVAVASRATSTVGGLIDA